LQQAQPLVDVILEETARVPRDVIASALAMALAHVCQRAGIPIEMVRVVMDAAFVEDRRLSAREAS